MFLERTRTPKAELKFGLAVIFLNCWWSTKPYIFCGNSTQWCEGKQCCYGGFTRHEKRCFNWLWQSLFYRKCQRFVTNVLLVYFLNIDTFVIEPISLFSKLKWLPIFDLIKLRKLVLLFTILNNPDAPLCLKRKFNFLSSVRSTGLRTRACAYNLQAPYHRSNSGKGTFAYSAATLFNCLDTYILFIFILLVTFLILKN